MAYIVGSTIEILQRYLDEHQPENHLHDDTDIIPHIQSFLHQARSFTDFLIDSDFNLRDENLYPDPVFFRMIDAAYKAEDAVELHIIRSSSGTNQQPSDEESLDQVLDLVAQQFQYIQQQMSGVIDEGSQPTYSWPIDNSLLLQYLTSNSNTTKKKRRKVNDFVAIYEEDFQALKSRILLGPSHLQIIPIVGMVGMGKRTLAQRLFNDSSVADHFHVCAWVTVPYVEDAQVVLLNLLESLGNVITKELRRLTVDELGILVRNDLRYRRYFIALHDVGDFDTIKALRNFCPDDGHGCRILYTASKEDDDYEATTVEWRGEPHVMRYLTDSESWLLFCDKVFALDHCPDHEFESIGRVIVGYCRGITQLVVCVAGQLATSEKTPSFWEIVAQALGSTLEGETDHAEIIVFVSFLIYNHLPYYVKPCLLYMGAFAECCDIRASKIIKLWMSEGFIKQIADASMEDVAAAYLEILIDKNLLHLTRQDATAKVKAFQILPLSRRIYMLAAKDEKFVWSKDYFAMYKDEGNVIRRVSGSQLLRTSNEIVLSPLARSFLSSGHALEEPTPVFVRLRLLRILDVFQLELFQFPLGIVQLVLLRYLAFNCHLNIPDSISNLWNLHALVIRRIPSFRAFALSTVLLGMAQLIHIKCKETFVWHHPENEREHLNEKLETLTNMQLFGVTSEFFEQVPNIRKLGIVCNIAMDNVLDLSCLDKLETLKCSTDNSLASKSFLSYIKFPSSLRKVTLNLCKIPCGFMKVVGALSSLEELKVQNSDFMAADSRPTEPEWEPEEGEFPRLISLVMKDLNLVHWKARASHFPRLRQLIILSCYAMIGIPLDIGDIETLELIHVNEHSPSVVASVMQIKEKHAASGNQILEVQIIKS